LCKFQEVEKATQKNPYLLPFFDEVLNVVTRYEAVRWIPRIPSKNLSP
jgi:hypothetical protein